MLQTAIIGALEKQGRLLYLGGSKHENDNSYVRNGSLGKYKS